MFFKSFFDQRSCTFTYLIVDEKEGVCAVIDPVLDYDPVSTKVHTYSADNIIEYIKSNNLKNEWILETHMHADHITSASYLKRKIGGKICIGDGIKKVLEFWVDKFDLHKDVKIDGSQFDRLFSDNDKFKIGSIEVEVLHTPGHTPACCSYIIKEAKCIFIGDTLFAPQLGTGRCDFPGGSAEDLYRAIEKFYSFPGDTQLLLCHDYPQDGVKPTNLITVEQSKKNNIMLNEKTTLEDFVKARKLRDSNLALPKLLFHSVQTNVSLGEFTGRLTNGIQYIKIPINFS